MNRTQTLRKRSEYVAVYERGEGWRDNLIVMKVLNNQLGLSRFGFSVGKEIGKAVVRNRVRRWLREITRRITVKPGLDIVLIVRPGVVATGYHQLRKSVEKLLMRAQLTIDNETVNAGID